MNNILKSGWISFTVVVICLISNFATGYAVGMNVGTNKVDVDIIDENDYLLKEIETRDSLIACLATMLHDYYQFNDKEYDSKGNEINSHNFFFDCIMSTDAYMIANDILGDNWGNFFTNWNYNPNNKEITINKWQGYGKKAK